MTDQPHFHPDMLNDPNLDADMLHQMATASPDFWPGILQHPQCYPDLANWITSQMPQQQTLTQYPQQAQNQGLVNMSDGAKQVANNTKTFFTDKVGPQVSGMVSQVGTTQNQTLLRTYAPYAAIFFAYNAMLAYGLPLASVDTSYASITVSHFSTWAYFSGYFFIIPFLVSVVIGIIALIKKTRALQLTSSIIGVVAGAMGIISNLIIMLMVNSMVDEYDFDSNIKPVLRLFTSGDLGKLIDDMTIGSTLGPKLIILCSLFLVAVSIVGFFPSKEPLPEQSFE